MKTSLTPDQERLLALGNEVTRQLRAGRMDQGALHAAIPDPDKHTPLRSFAEAFKNGMPPPPKGVGLRSLPELTRASGGLMGLWVVAGETGVGKSTFALQTALDYSRHEGHSVLIYDYENGPEVIANHVGAAMGSAKKARERTERWYYRESIYSLNHDLGLCKCRGRERRRHGVVETPALVLVDSLQALASDDSAYHVLRKWLGVFEGLARRGFVVLALSEKSRGTYGRATTSGFADVRAEYKAWFGVQLLRDRDDEDLIHLYAVKNRHRKFRGHVLDLYREDGWRFREEPVREEEEEE